MYFVTSQKQHTVWVNFSLTLGAGVFGSGSHLAVEFLLVLHPHVLGERVLLGEAAQDHFLADLHVRGDVAETRIFHFSPLTPTVRKTAARSTTLRET